jgi:hypothetical protein
MIWPFFVRSFSLRSLSVKHAAGDGSVAVDTPVAQKGPVAANVFQMMQVNFAKQNFFLVVRTLGEYAAKGVAEKRPSPEFKPFARYGIAANVSGLEADTIHDANINAISNSVCPLDGAPGIVLCRAEFGLLRRMPSDSRGVKKNAGSL